MKKILIVLLCCASALACFSALNLAANHGQRRLTANQIDWLAETQQLADARAKFEALATKVSDLKEGAEKSASVALLDPALVSLLLTNNLNSLSAAEQSQLLAAIGAGRNSAANYVLISKAVLAQSDIRPLKRYPDTWQLSSTARETLAITPDEQKSVEAAFAQETQRAGDWAQANVKRQAGSYDEFPMLVQTTSGELCDPLVTYTIPANPDFENSLTTDLFTTISNAVGQERAELLRQYFEVYRIFEDGAIGQNTKVLSLYRARGKAEVLFREGWLASDGTQNNFNDPEPIVETNRFPVAFRPVFLNGWQDVAKREGFTLDESAPAN